MIGWMSRAISENEWQIGSVKLFLLNSHLFWDIKNS